MKKLKIFISLFTLGSIALAPLSAIAHEGHDHDSTWLQMPQVLGESITPTVLSNTSYLTLTITPYQYDDASGKWNYKISWKRKAGLKGSITINNNPFVADASSSGEQFTGFGLTPNNRYLITYKSAANYRGSNILRKSFTVASSTTSSPANSNTSSTNNSTNSSAVDLTKLPLGDGKYSTTGAKQGYIFLCNANNNGIGGSQANGPWINGNTWDKTSKSTVSGNVAWPNATFSISTNGDNRVFTGNGLPINHNTGTYPIGTTDPVYQYDRNPNSIKSQTISITVPKNPTAASTPGCIRGMVGISLSGVPIFDGFDAEYRDAVAHEVQDKCEGHPEVTGQYHYHDVSKCLPDKKTGPNGSSDLIGYAFDGFGIFGKFGPNGKIYTNADLDECHGITSEIMWDGKKVSMYHYVATDEFPYSVSCFKAKSYEPQPSGSGQGGMRQGNGQRPPQGY